MAKPSVNIVHMHCIVYVSKMFHSALICLLFQPCCESKGSHDCSIYCGWCRAAGLCLLPAISPAPAVTAAGRAAAAHCRPIFSDVYHNIIETSVKLPQIKLFMLDNLAFTQKLDNNYTTASMGHYIKLAQ